MSGKQENQDEPTQVKVEKTKANQKKIHLVILTHGLHSNLGADMLFLKESIDSAARKAKEDAKKRRQKSRNEQSRAAHDNNRQNKAGDQPGSESEISGQSTEPYGDNINVESD